MKCGTEEELHRVKEFYITLLGLSICREIVNQLNGKITIKSQEGGKETKEGSSQGTIVWVSIPCKLIEIDHK